MKKKIAWKISCSLKHIHVASVAHRYFHMALFFFLHLFWLHLLLWLCLYVFPCLSVFLWLTFSAWFREHFNSIFIDKRSVSLLKRKKKIISLHPPKISFHYVEFWHGWCDDKMRTRHNWKMFKLENLITVH